MKDGLAVCVVEVEAGVFAGCVFTSHSSIFSLSVKRSILIRCVDTLCAVGR